MVEVLPGGDHAIVVHHCACCRGDRDTWVSARYPLPKYELGIGMLLGFSTEHVTFSVNGGWTYENPYKMYYIGPNTWVISEFRDDLKAMRDVPAFIRLCGKGWPEGLEPR